MPMLTIRAPAKAPNGSWAFYRARGDIEGAGAAVGTIAGDLQISTINGAGAARCRLHGKTPVNGDGAAAWNPAAIGPINGAGGATVGGAPTFGNGYAYRRRVIVPAASVRGGADLADYILYVDHTDLAWRSASNGGQVESASGFDLRIESEAGVKWAHARATCDFATGAVRLWVKVPTLSASADTAFFIYHGKSGAADEASLGSVWSAYLAVWQARTGVDLTGNNRTLTPANVTAGTLIGEAGDYNGTTSEAATAAAITWPDGLGSIQVEAYVQADATGGTGAVVSSGLSAAASDGDLGIMLGHDSPGVGGAAAQTIAFKLQTKTTATAPVSFGTRVEAPANSQGTLPQMIVGAWTSGQAPKLFVGDAAKGGRFVTASNTPASKTGTTDISRGGSIFLGKAPFGRRWAGLIDEVRLRVTPLSEGHLQTQCANYLEPTMFYGIGDARPAVTTNAPPVAVPDRATITATEAQVDVDVLANDFEPDSGDTKALTSVSGTGFSVVAGKVRFIKPTGWVGPSYATYVITSGGRTDTGHLRVDEASSAPAGGTGDFAGHNGPMTTLVDTSVTPNVTYSVPSFMKGWERDTAYTAGVRFRCPQSKRQFRAGEFNNNTWEAYMGAPIAFHGANMIGYGLTGAERTAKLTDTWPRIAGGPQDPNSSGVYSSPAGGYYPNNLTNHGNFVVFNASRSTIAAGLYLSTLPFGTATATDVSNAIAAYDPVNNNVHKWWKAYFSRLKDQSNLYGNPVLVLRPNWEGMTQDTGLKLAAGSWFNAGYTKTQYNAMMRNFCRAGKDFGPPNMYIVISPSFEATAEGPAAPQPFYEEWMTDDVVNGGPGTAAWVGYTGTCSSIHPDSRSPRASTEAQARGCINGTSGLARKYLPARAAIDCSIKYKVPFFSLEIGPSTPFTNATLHDATAGPTFYGDTFDELGQIVNDPTMYGLIGAFGFLDLGTILIPATAAGDAKGSMPAFWDANDKSNMDRCSKIIRKHFGHKPTYGGAAIPARV